MQQHPERSCRRSSIRIPYRSNLTSQQWHPNCRLWPCNGSAPSPSQSWQPQHSSSSPNCSNKPGTPTSSPHSPTTPAPTTRRSDAVVVPLRGRERRLVVVIRVRISTGRSLRGSMVVRRRRLSCMVRGGGIMCMYFFPPILSHALSLWSIYEKKAPKYIYQKSKRKKVLTHS